MPNLRDAGDLGNKEWSEIEAKLSTPRLSAVVIEAVLYNDSTEVNRINQDYGTGELEGGDSAFIVSFSAAQING